MENYWRNGWKRTWSRLKEWLAGHDCDMCEGEGSSSGTGL